MHRRQSSRCKLQINGGLLTNVDCPGPGNVTWLVYRKVTDAISDYKQSNCPEAWHAWAGLDWAEVRYGGDAKCEMLRLLQYT